jgi:ArsR family transcriptional regulator, virulence genes transcriptional regulator
MAYDIYSAFGNQIRTKLILCLAQRSKNVTQMIQTCGLSQSAVSQHLAKLKKSGVIKSEKEGKEVWYSLKYKKAAEISKLLLSLEQEMK